MRCSNICTRLANILCGSRDKDTSKKSDDASARQFKSPTNEKTATAATSALANSTSSIESSVGGTGLTHRSQQQQSMEDNFQEGLMDALLKNASAQGASGSAVAFVRAASDAGKIFGVQLAPAAPSNHRHLQARTESSSASPAGILPRLGKGIVGAVSAATSLLPPPAGVVPPAKLPPKKPTKAGPAEGAGAKESLLVEKVQAVLEQHGLEVTAIKKMS